MSQMLRATASEGVNVHPRDLPPNKVGVGAPSPLKEAILKIGITELWLLPKAEWNRDNTPLHTVTCAEA